MSDYSVGERGEFAASPRDIPRRGWKQVLLRVKEQVSTDNLSVVSAGVAFYGLLAIFPGLAVLVTLYGLFAEPAAVQEQLAPLREIMPPEAYQIIADQLEKVSGEADSSLGFGLLVSLALTVWSSTKGIKALMTAMNIAYNEPEKRGLVLGNVTAVVFTVGAVVFTIVSFAVIGAIPALLKFIDLGEPLNTLVRWLRWLVLIFFFVIALAVLYRYGPSRANARLQWITPGAIAATLLWLLGSILFSVYVTNFGSYNETFGSLGAVVILLFWLYLSAFVICLGAELNAELEHQTYRDSTTGPPRAAGSRGAYVADHTAGDE